MGLQVLLKSGVALERSLDIRMCNGGAQNLDKLLSGENVSPAKIICTRWMRCSMCSNKMNQMIEIFRHRYAILQQHSLSLNTCLSIMDIVLTRLDCQLICPQIGQRALGCVRELCTPGWFFFLKHSRSQILKDFDLPFSVANPVEGRRATP